MLTSLFALSFSAAFAQGKAIIDTNATYTLVSQLCEDGKPPLGAGGNGGSVTVKFNGEKMILANSKFPGKDVAVDYRLEGSHLVNVNARTKEEVKTKLQPKGDQLTWISELPKSKADAKKICPRGGKTVRSTYKKS